MTEEATNPNVAPDSYEGLRDSARGEAASLWKTADREEASLSRFYEELQHDPRYTSEHKSELAWARFNKAKAKIVESKAKASEQLANDAAVYRRQALPFPPSEGPITSDTQKILISQNESARLSRKLARMQDQATGPFRPDLTSALREEYERGLELGGVMGGSLCRAVLAVCDEVGVDADSVVDGFRAQRHRELIERAQHAEYLQGYLGKRVSPPPYPKPASEKARIAGIGAPAPEGDEVNEPGRGKKLFPNKPQSHVSRGSGRLNISPAPTTPHFERSTSSTADEVSKRRRNKNG
jgi:hypothetical protein